MWRGVENTLAITSSWCTLPALQRKTTIQSCHSQPWCKKWWTSSVSWVSHPTSWGDNEFRGSWGEVLVELLGTSSTLEAFTAALPISFGSWWQLLMKCRAGLTAAGRKWVRESLRGVTRAQRTNGASSITERESSTPALPRLNLTVPPPPSLSAVDWMFLSLPVHKLKLKPQCDGIGRWGL